MNASSSDARFSWSSWTVTPRLAAKSPTQVAVVPGEAFGKTGYIRLSYALGMDDLVEGVSRIQNLING